MNGLPESLDALILILREHATWLPWVLVALAALLGLFFVLGWMTAKLTSVRRLANMEARLAQEKQQADERIAAMDHHFSTLSSEALRHNNQQFLDLAQQSMQNFNLKAQQDFKFTEQSIENMVRPLQDSLNRAEQQLRRFDQERRQSHESLTAQIQTMSSNQHILEREARNLVKALGRPEIRGRWGEIGLRKLVELAGMVDHCDFVEQGPGDLNDKTVRPDMVIHLPGARQIVIDVKTPLDAYLQALEATDEGKQRSLLLRHASQLRNQIKSLASKQYWSQFKHSPDFVVLFIPGDQFLSSALEADGDLLEYALSLRVILATPTSLIALLRTIAYGWKQDQFHIHADEMREMAKEYHHRLATLSEHFDTMSSDLFKLISSYNQSVGSFERSVMPIARKFADLGMTRNKTVALPPDIDPSAIRQPGKRN